MRNKNFRVRGNFSLSERQLPILEIEKLEFSSPLGIQLLFYVLLPNIKAVLEGKCLKNRAFGYFDPKKYFYTQKRLFQWV